MPDEEKKAIEMIEHIQECNTLIGYRVEDRTILAKALLNLIEKQQKEIEELKEQCKEVVCVPKGTCFMLVPKDIDKKWEDKIKAKIEEYEKQQKEEPDAYLCIKVLQSLLEKE